MIDYEDFGRLARTSSMRCVAFVRHGERPRIPEDDPTFGENLPLSPAGERMARECGEALRRFGPPVSEWVFLASRLLRTRLTAAAVASAMGAYPDCVRVSPEASIPGLFVEDQAETHRHYFAEGSVPFTERFFRDGRAEGYRPMAETVRLTMDWIRRGLGARCAFVASHDVFAGILLQGLGVARVDCAHWVGFLQGCALFEREDGSWQADWIVPDKSAPAAVFVQ